MSYQKAKFINLGRKSFFLILLCQCDLIGHPRSEVDMPNEIPYPKSQLKCTQVSINP